MAAGNRSLGIHGLSRSSWTVTFCSTQFLLANSKGSADRRFAALPEAWESRNAESAEQESAMRLLKKSIRKSVSDRAAFSKASLRPRPAGASDRTVGSRRPFASALAGARGVPGASSRYQIPYSLLRISKSDRNWMMADFFRTDSGKREIPVRIGATRAVSAQVGMIAALPRTLAGGSNQNRISRSSSSAGAGLAASWYSRGSSGNAAMANKTDKA